MYEADAPPMPSLVRFVNDRIQAGRSIADWNAVDLGSGFGATSAYIASQGASVKSVDADPASAEFLHKQLQRRIDRATASGKSTLHFGSIEPVLSRFEKLNLPANSVDMIVSNNSLPYVPANDLLKVVQHAHDTLKPGGYFIATFFGPDHPMGMRAESPSMSESQIRQLMSAFDDLSISRNQSGLGLLADGSKTSLDLIEVVAKKQRVSANSASRNNSTSSPEAQRSDETSQQAREPVELDPKKVAREIAQSNFKVIREYGDQIVISAKNTELPFQLPVIAHELNNLQRLVDAGVLTPTFNKATLEGEDVILMERFEANDQDVELARQFYNQVSIDDLLRNKRALERSGLAATDLQFLVNRAGRMAASDVGMLLDRDDPEFEETKGENLMLINGLIASIERQMTSSNAAPSDENLDQLLLEAEAIEQPSQAMREFFDLIEGESNNDL
jgi:SAM-dependent methyltransferase